jgi:hypothetical protein
MKSLAILILLTLGASAQNGGAVCGIECNPVESVRIGQNVKCTQNNVTWIERGSVCHWLERLREPAQSSEVDTGARPYQPYGAGRARARP